MGGLISGMLGGAQTVSAVGPNAAIAANAVVAGPMNFRANAVNDRTIITTDTAASTQYALSHPAGSGGEMRISYITGGVDIIRFKTNGAMTHASTLLSFYNATATTKQSVTGSRVANPALASLLTALATLGLITDGSSA